RGRHGGHPRRRKSSGRTRNARRDADRGRHPRRPPKRVRALVSVRLYAVHGHRGAADPGGPDRPAGAESRAMTAVAAEAPTAADVVLAARGISHYYGSLAAL